MRLLNQHLLEIKIQITKLLLMNLPILKMEQAKFIKNMSKKIISAKNSIFYNSPVKSVLPICKENLNPIIETMEGKKLNMTM